MEQSDICSIFSLLEAALGTLFTNGIYIQICELNGVYGSMMVMRVAIPFPSLSPWLKKPQVSDCKQFRMLSQCPGGFSLDPMVFSHITKSCRKCTGEAKVVNEHESECTWWSVME